MSLVERSRYGANYIPDIEEFKKQVRDKSVIPYQVEFQPGPLKGNLCWLKCPYCYGGSATDTGERLSRERAIEALNEIADGGVNKVIFAGYCTDPLNYEYIDDLLDVAVERGLIFGFNTKALRISRSFLEILEMPEVMPESYISVSVDAGNNESYNRVHGVSGSYLYSKVIKNLKRLIERKGRFDVTVTYLINRLNHNKDEIKQFIEDVQDADLIRFAFAQQPRGTGDLITVPTAAEQKRYKATLLPIIHDMDINKKVMLADVDIDKSRTLPCVARWVYPAIGFDGWVYPCSQSAAPNFRKMALGNVAEKNFWDIFDDYDVNNLHALDWAMEEVGCRCDRKEHVLNSKVGRHRHEYY
jgi:MoaA/NifB/PqqE/SkfB family radical SAM enzyme